MRGLGKGGGGAEELAFLELKTGVGVVEGLTIRETAAPKQNNIKEVC